MRHLRVLESRLRTVERAEFGLRVVVCRHCSGRPLGSDSLGADSPRTCEPECALFNRLPELLDAANCMDPMLGSVEQSLGNQLKQISTFDSATTLTFNGLDDRHPWSVQKHEIISVLQNLFHN